MHVTSLGVEVEWMDSCTGGWGQSWMEDGWRNWKNSSCPWVGGGEWIEKRKGENCSCSGTEGKEKNTL